MACRWIIRPENILQPRDLGAPGHGFGGILSTGSVRRSGPSFGLSSWAESDRPTTTGGLDTRMILANINAPKEAVRCYSFGGPYRECLDVTIGRRVAQEAGYAHTVIKIDNPFFTRFAELAERVVSCTDGNIELSGVPNLYVNEHSRRISAIRLTGNYGSEVLRRHRAFCPSNSACLVLNPDFSDFVSSAELKWSQTRAGNRMTFVAFKQVPWYSYNRLQVEQSLLTMRSPFMRYRLLEVVYRARLKPSVRPP